MVVVGVVMSLEENKDDIDRNGFWNLGILVSTVLGSILSFAWVLLAHHGVKQEKLTLFVWLERTLPLNFIFPVLAVVFGESRQQGRGSSGDLGWRASHVFLLWR